MNIIKDKKIQQIITKENENKKDAVKIPQSRRKMISKIRIWLQHEKQEMIGIINYQ